MKIPPKKLTIKPKTETPPFVPRGTRFRVVIKIGSDFDNMPSSEAHVSPFAIAKEVIIPTPSQLLT